MKKNLEQEQIKKELLDNILYSFMVRKHEHYMPLIEKLVCLILLKIDIEDKRETKLFLTQESIEKFKDYSCLQALEKDKSLGENYQKELELYKDALEGKLVPYRLKIEEAHNLVYGYVLQGFMSCELKFKALEEKYQLEQLTIAHNHTKKGLVNKI